MASKHKPGQALYCRIFQWIEVQDEKFAAAIRDLCLEGILSPGPRLPGVTFLYPRDEAYRREITDKSVTDEADTAVKMIEALVLPDYFGDVKDFKAAKDGERTLGSRGGVAYKVDSASAKSVKLEGDVELTPCKEFRTLASKKDEIAIWYVEKGRLPTTGEPYKPTLVSKKKKGGQDSSPSDAEAIRACRAKFAAKIAGEFSSAAMRHINSNSYLAAVVSILHHLKAHHPETLAAVLPLLDPEPLVAFYLIFEPYKTAGAHAIPQDQLYGPGQWNEAIVFERPVEEYKEFLSGAGAPPELLAAIDGVRQERVASSQADLQQKLLAAYDAPVAGAIGGVAYPNHPTDADKYRWQCEFRFVTYLALDSCYDVTFDLAKFEKLQESIRNFTPGNDYRAEVSIHSRGEGARAGMMPDKRYTREQIVFINSSDFLYVPVAPAAVLADGAKPFRSRDADELKLFWNRNAEALKHLEKYSVMNREAGVSPAAIAEVSAYVSRHGALPPVLAQLGATVSLPPAAGK